MISYWYFFSWKLSSRIDLFLKVKLVIHHPEETLQKTHNNKNVVSATPDYQTFVTNLPGKVPGNPGIISRRTRQLELVGEEKCLNFKTNVMVKKEDHCCRQTQIKREEEVTAQRSEAGGRAG